MLTVLGHLIQLIHSGGFPPSGMRYQLIREEAGYMVWMSVALGAVFGTVLIVPVLLILTR